MTTFRVPGWSDGGRVAGKTAQPWCHELLLGTSVYGRLLKKQLLFQYCLLEKNEAVESAVLGVPVRAVARRMLWKSEGTRLSSDRHA